MVVVMKKMLMVSLGSKVGYAVARQTRSYFSMIRFYKKNGNFDCIHTTKMMLSGYLHALYDLDKLSDADYYFLLDLGEQIAFGRSERLAHSWRRFLK